MAASTVAQTLLRSTPLNALAVFLSKENEVLRSGVSFSQLISWEATCSVPHEIGHFEDLHIMGREALRAERDKYEKGLERGPKIRNAVPVVGAALLAGGVETVAVANDYHPLAAGLGGAALVATTLWTARDNLRRQSAQKKVEIATAFRPYHNRPAEVRARRREVDFNNSIQRDDRMLAVAILREEAEVLREGDFLLSGPLKQPGRWATWRSALRSHFR